MTTGRTPTTAAAAALTRRSAVPVVAALLLVGCSFGGGGDDDEATTADEPATEQPAAVEETPDEPTGTDGVGDVHELIGFDSGVQIAVGVAEVDADLVRVPIQAWNGTVEDTLFAGSEPVLTDNTGTDYRFVPPDSNAELRTPSGEVMRGVLVFELDAEELPDSPGRFNLELNRFSGNNPQAEFRDVPFESVG